MGPAGTQPLTTLCTPKNPAVITARLATMAGSEPGSVTSTPAAASRQLAATTARREKRPAIRPAKAELRLPTG